MTISLDYAQKLGARITEHLAAAQAIKAELAPIYETRRGALDGGDSDYIQQLAEKIEPLRTKLYQHIRDAADLSETLSSAEIIAEK